MYQDKTTTDVTKKFDIQLLNSLANNVEIVIL